jgi:ketosteroid isomerase-like protein
VAQARGDAGLSSSRETYEKIYEAYNAGDFDACFALIDPAIEWIEPRRSPDAEVKHGHEGVRQSLTKFVGTWTDYRFEPRDFTENGDRLLVNCHISGKGKTSGTPVEMDQFQVWTFRAGKAVRLEMFTDESEAREAAGLEQAKERAE